MVGYQGFYRNKENKEIFFPTKLYEIQTRKTKYFKFTSTFWFHPSCRRPCPRSWGDGWRPSTSWGPRQNLNKDLNPPPFYLLLEAKIFFLYKFINIHNFFSNQQSPTRKTALKKFKNVLWGKKYLQYLTLALKHNRGGLGKKNDNQAIPSRPLPPTPPEVSPMPLLYN